VVDRDLLAAKLSELADRVERVRRHCPATAAALAGDRLRERGVLGAETAEALGRASGLRNIGAHVYGRVDAALVHQAATFGLRDLELFASEVAAWAEAQARS
jgi:uncharacterized protein YutE (UPF0331/DUF86 family)